MIELGLIVIGERELEGALDRFPHLACIHQVEIVPKWYTADLLCYHLGSKKLAAIEVDGSQHWSDSGQIRRDRERMHQLGKLGVATIRFINFDAQKKPMKCARIANNILAKPSFW